MRILALAQGLGVKLLETERLGERKPRALIDGVARRSDRERAVGGDFSGDLERAIDQPGGGRETADEAPSERRLGADRIVLSTDTEQMQAVSGRYDLIIDTVPYAHDLNPYLPALAVGATLVLVGYLGELDPALNTTLMVLHRKSVAGSLIGGIAETQELLDFCGQHGITSDIETIRIQDINAAYERMLKSDVKYRFVIDMGSIKAEAG